MHFYQIENIKFIYDSHGLTFISILYVRLRVCVCVCVLIDYSPIATVSHFYCRAISPSPSPLLGVLSIFAVRCVVTREISKTEAPRPYEWRTCSQGFLGTFQLSRQTKPPSLREAVLFKGAFGSKLFFPLARSSILERAVFFRRNNSESAIRSHLFCEILETKQFPRLDSEVFEFV